MERLAKLTSQSKCICSVRWSSGLDEEEGSELYIKYLLILTPCSGLAFYTSAMMLVIVVLTFVLLSINVNTTSTPIIVGNEIKDNSVISKSPSKATRPATPFELEKHSKAVSKSDNCDAIIAAIQKGDSLELLLKNSNDSVHCKVGIKGRPVTLLHVVKNYKQAEELISYGININFTTLNGDEAIFAFLNNPLVLLSLLMNGASVNVFSSVLIPEKPHYVKLNPIDSVALCFLSSPSTDYLLSLMITMVRNVPLSFSNLSHFPPKDVLYTIEEIKFLHSYISRLVVFRMIPHPTENRISQLVDDVDEFLSLFSNLEENERLKTFSYILAGYKCFDIKEHKGQKEVDEEKVEDSKNEENIFIRKGLEKLVCDRHCFTTIV